MALVKKNKFIFTYQTKCLVSGKTYIGYHSTYNLNDGYIGCGIRSQSYVKGCLKYGIKSPLLSAVSKYGYDNFTTIPLCFFDTIEEAIEEEKYLVNEEYIKNSNNYNASLGGNGGMPFSVSKEKCDIIIKDFLSGTKKVDILKKYNISFGVMYKITKMYDIKGRKNADTDRTKFIKKWINDNSHTYIDLYKKRKISKSKIEKIVPFDLWRNNFLKGIELDPLLILIKDGNEIPIRNTSDIKKNTDIEDPRIGLAIKFTKQGKLFRNYKFILCN